MYTKRDLHTPQWLGTEIVGATQCTNTGLQNITRPAGAKDARKNFDYLEVGTGARKIRLYSTADAIFIKASAVLSQLKVQPRAAAVYSRYLVDKAKKSRWTHDIKAENEWLVLDGLEFSQEEYGESLIPLPLEFLSDREVLDRIEDGAVLLNVSKITLGVLNRLEDMREARLRDRGKTRDSISPEQAARMVRKMGKIKAVK